MHSLMQGIISCSLTPPHNKERFMQLGGAYQPTLDAGRWQKKKHSLKQGACISYIWRVYFWLRRARIFFSFNKSLLIDTTFMGGVVPGRRYVVPQLYRYIHRTRNTTILVWIPTLCLDNSRYTTRQ